MLNFNEYLNTTYASWLGKIIGIRLGAPVENWRHDDLKKTYERIDDYPVDYGVFAADDDSNGPLFFVRSLLEEASEDIDVEKMADSILGYISDGHGFFWWGGIGVSTEDTSYHNLAKGMSAKLSGKAITNGKAIANQIGGQIFSDCWGYVAYGKADRACKLASKMSSITHDEDGIQGGIFVAVCIALAYHVKDCRSIIDEALTYLDQNSAYYACVKDIISLYENNYSENDALNYILDKYRYEYYDGVCHIIPNTAIMIYAMLYGNNDFSKTLTLLCECGWDTDCTCGNVGSIMGAMVGIDGIDSKWIKPINDILLSSSSMGYLNIDSVSNTALTFAKIGAMLENVEIPYIDDHYYFDLPYARHGLTADSYSYCQLSLVNRNDYLKCVIQGYEGYKNRIYRKSYYHVNDIYDNRYDPCFSPILYNGNTIGFKLSGSSDISIKLYAKDDIGNIIYGPRIVLDDDARWYCLKIDKFKNSLYVEYGIEVTCNKRILHDSFIIHEMSVDNISDYEIDFTKLDHEYWGLNYVGENTREIMGCTTKYARSYLDHGLHINNDTVTFGSVNASLKSMVISGKYDGDMEIRVGVKSYTNYLGIKFDREKVMVYECDGRNDINVVFQKNLKEIYCNFTLILSAKNGLINVEIGNDVFIVPSSISKGAIAISSNSSLIIYGCKLETI